MLGDIAEVKGIDWGHCVRFPFGATADQNPDEELDTLIGRIASVGHGGRGFAFMPTAEDNIGFDHYLVLPKVGGGCVVLAFQEKAWFDDTIMRHSCAGQKHVVREARWGRQYFLQDEVWTKRSHFDRDNSRCANKFLQYLKMRNFGPTDYIFVLVTPNKVGSLSEMAPSRVPRTTETACTQYGDVMAVADVVPNEGWLSLEGMQRWCPTVAYAALGSLKLRSTLSRFEGLAGL